MLDFSILKKLKTLIAILYRECLDPYSKEKAYPLTKLEIKELSIEDRETIIAYLEKIESKREIEKKQDIDFLFAPFLSKLPIADFPAPETAFSILKNQLYIKFNVQDEISDLWAKRKEREKKRIEKIEKIQEELETEIKAKESTPIKTLLNEMNKDDRLSLHAKSDQSYPRTRFFIENLSSKDREEIVLFLKSVNLDVEYYRDRIQSIFVNDKNVLKHIALLKGSFFLDLISKSKPGGEATNSEETAVAEEQFSVLEDNLGVTTSGSSSTSNSDSPEDFDIDLGSVKVPESEVLETKRIEVLEEKWKNLFSGIDASDINKIRSVFESGLSIFQIFEKNEKENQTAFDLMLIKENFNIIEFVFNKLVENIYRMTSDRPFEEIKKITDRINDLKTDIDKKIIFGLLREAINHYPRFSERLETENYRMMNLDFEKLAEEIYKMTRNRQFEEMKKIIDRIKSAKAGRVIASNIGNVKTDRIDEVIDIDKKIVFDLLRKAINHYPSLAEREEISNLYPTIIPSEVWNPVVEAWWEYDEDAPRRQQKSTILMPVSPASESTHFRYSFDVVKSDSPNSSSSSTTGSPIEKRVSRDFEDKIEEEIKKIRQERSMSNRVKEALDVKEKLEKKGGDTLLHLAVKNSQVKRVAQLLELSAADLDVKNENGETPMEIAFNKQDIAVLSLLMQTKLQNTSDLKKEIEMLTRECWESPGFGIMGALENVLSNLPSHLREKLSKDPVKIMEEEIDKIQRTSLRTGDLSAIRNRVLPGLEEWLQNLDDEKKFQSEIEANRIMQEKEEKRETKKAEQIEEHLLEKRVQAPESVRPKESSDLKQIAKLSSQLALSSQEKSQTLAKLRNKTLKVPPKPSVAPPPPPTGRQKKQEKKS